ncbi:unnamed protein product, partial [marine sediment metagenome]
MKVTISILTFNRARLLRELLLSTREISYAPLEVLVVDNHSEDGTESMVKSEFPEIHFFRMPENKGVGARNRGISEATGDVVITLDDDV